MFTPPRYVETFLVLRDHQTHLVARQGDYVDFELSLRVLKLPFMTPSYLVDEMETPAAFSALTVAPRSRPLNEDAL